VLYADGKIDQEEADFIFEINDAVSGKKNDTAWNQFFVQAISDYLLNDEKSPGVIDEEEGKWLVEKIGADGQVDGVEKQLLINLKKNAKSMPSSVISLIDGSKNQPTPPNPVPPTPPTPSGGDESNGKWKKYAAILGNYSGERTEIHKKYIPNEIYQNAKDMAMEYYLAFVEKDANNEPFNVPEYDF
jgi:hypothetical protein